MYLGSQAENFEEGDVAIEYGEIENGNIEFFLTSKRGNRKR